MNKKLMDPIKIPNRDVQLLLDAKLTEEQYGEVVLALLEYQARGTLTKIKDPVSMAFWRVIHANLKRKYGERIR